MGLDSITFPPRMPGFFENVHVALRSPGSEDAVTASHSSMIFDRLSRGDPCSRKLSRLGVVQAV